MLLRIGAVGLLLLCSSPTAFTQTTNPPAPPAQPNGQKRTHVWWRDSAPGQRPYNKDNKRLPLISVNRFSIHSQKEQTA